MEVKICIDCEQEKPLRDFYTNGILNGRQRYRPECKSCNCLRKMKNYTRKSPMERKCIYCGDVMKVVYNKKRAKVCSKKECRKRYNKAHHAEVKSKIFELLGGKCANPFNLPHPDWCNDPEILQIDHIHGGGLKESIRYSFKYFDKILKRIKSGSKDYQLLCPNCNWLKRVKNKEERGKGS